MAGGASELSAAGTFTTDGHLDAGSDDAGSGTGGSGADAGVSDPGAGGTSAGAGATNAGAAASSAGASGTAASGGDAAKGGTASGGSAGTAGSPANLPDPACMDGIVKGSACTAASAPLCYKSCGPNNLGFKSETCQSGTYNEQSGCTFPAAQDYSCYKIPTSLPAVCPSATVPRAGTACQVANCNVCFGGIGGPQYQDSTGTQKPGYCVCSDAGIWTCASTTSWPCPDGPGCD